MTTRRTSNEVLDQIEDEVRQAAKQLAQTQAAIANTPALDCGDLWSLFQTDKNVAWTALADLSERQLVVQAAAMASYLFDAEAILISAEMVLTTWRTKLAKRAAAQVEPAPSDPTLPAIDAILDAAQEYGETAQRRGDFRTMRRLERVRENLIAGARLAWGQGGELRVWSVNNPGQVYSVQASGCSCPNGTAGQALCWHIPLRNLLIEMAEDAAAAADILADAAEARAEREPEPPMPTIGQRIAAARAQVWGRAA